MSQNDPARTQAICAAFLAGTETAKIAERYGVKSPAIRRQLRNGGVLPPLARRGPRPLEAIEQAKAERKVVRSPAPPRDPCPRCGIRADIGCKHGWAP